MIKIITVKTHKQIKDFVMFPFKLYKDCDYWVPPIIKEEIEAMDTSKNPVFKNAEAEFYLAFDEKENIVGRIAAIVNWVEIKDQKKNKKLTREEKLANALKKNMKLRKETKN